MKIRVGVDAERSRLGRLVISDASGTRGPVDVCATADRAASRDPLRPGGPAPFGTYTLKEVHPVTGPQTRDLGDHTLVFEPRSGQARQAESVGRLVLAMHAGQPGDDGKLRTTSLGLRVWPDTLALVAAAAARGERVDLEIYEAPLSWWDRIRYCRRRPSRGFDDRTTTTRDRDDDDWRSTSSSSSSSSSSSESFGGKGGQFGGAGASGSWDATTTGAAVAAGAALGAGIAAASDSGSSGSDGSESDSGTDSGTDGGGTSY